jgi:uncharacterized protein YgiM (DUF1202 family)
MRRWHGVLNAGNGAAAVCLLGMAAQAGEVPVQVTSDRVNLRARPGTHYEVVGQAKFQQILFVKTFSESWAEIFPPEASTAWVHRDYLVKERVKATELNVRAGPSLHYSIIGKLPRGSRVEVQGEEGEWLKIIAPPACSYWIKTDFIRRIKESASSDPPEKKEPIAEMPREADSEPVVAEPSVANLPPPDPAAQVPHLELVPLAGQGEMGDFTGTLRYAGSLIGRPAKFRLVDGGSNRAKTVCHVHGNSDQLKKLIGRDMTIEGREYWARDVKLSIVVPERIVLKPKP